MTMNRELRRAQAKQDKKVEREKEERRAARRKRIDTLRSRRAARRAEVRANADKSADKKTLAKGEGGGEAKPAGKGGGAAGGRGRNPGRFAGALAMATVFFIVLQASVPPQEADNATLRSVTGAGFYLLFGYFAILWLMRRETPRPLIVTIAFGLMLTAGVEVAKLLQPEVPTDLLMLVLAVPGLVAGAFLGRLVFTSAPR